jgi:hypothetical protein
LPKLTRVALLKYPECPCSILLSPAHCRALLTPPQESSVDLLEEGL